VLVVQKQLRYVQTTRLGYDKERLLLVRNVGPLGPAQGAFLDALRALPGVQAATGADSYPVPSARNETIFYPEGVTDPKFALTTQVWNVDFDYMPAMGLEIAQGRAFDRSLATDSTAVVLNEAACRVLGWPEPVGKRLYAFLDNAATVRLNYTVIGVVRDFHFESLRRNITPLILRINREPAWIAGLRLAPGDPAPVVRAVEATYRRFLPAEPFRYSFLDEDFDAIYRAEQRIGRILGWFAAFAIFIACLGLFGLAAYTTEQRTKEIGIRKVLGATVAGITGLLARDFLRLVALSVVLATPLAWFAMQRWLRDFAYRTALEWWLFAAAGLVALAVAALAVSFQSMRAALANPTTSLKNE
jgi:putative ABC transport system permease protein